MAKDLYDTSVEVHSYQDDLSHHDAQGSLLAPETNMLILTWVVFFLLLAVLKKYAFGPILKGLDKREEEIRKSLENADRLEKEMAELEHTRTEILDRADDESKEIIDQARKASIEAGNTIKAKAKTEAQILFENAEREIQKEKDNAQDALKRQSAAIAVELASKLIEENLDAEKNQKLIDKIIEQM